MNPLLTTATVIMTRNAGTHWLITLALAATVGDAVELPAGNEITLRAPSGSPIPSEGSTVALRLEPRSGFAAPAPPVSGAGLAPNESNDAEVSKAEALAELKRHFAGIDNTGKSQTIVGADWDSVIQQLLAIRLAKQQSDDAMQDLNDAEASKAEARAELKRHSAESLDETRAFYEKALAEQKSLLADKEQQLTETLLELGSVRAALEVSDAHLQQATDLPLVPPEDAANAAPEPAPTEPAQSTLTEADFPNGIPTAPTPAGDPIDLAAEGLPTEVEPPPHSDPAPIALEPAN